MNPMPVLRKLDEVKRAAETIKSNEAQASVKATPRPQPVKSTSK